ncbi:YihY/virulence factor BrkB family protein [Aggregatilineales bacterium SYSU G02658]
MLKQIVQQWQSWRGQIESWWLTMPHATQTLPVYLLRAVRNFITVGSLHATSLAYFAVFSIFPLVLLLAIAIGAVVGPAVAQEQIINGLALFLPAETAQTLQETVFTVVDQGTQFGVVALVGLLWSATGLFSGVTRFLDEIFVVPALRSMWRMRLLALVMGVILVGLVIASFLTSGILRLFSALALELNIWFTVGTVFLPLGLNLVIFALLFRFVPTRYVHWDAIWPAAMFGAVGWELAKSAFQWYLANLANYSIIYGSIATGIVLLFWAYLLASIFLLSAEICARLNEWLIAEDEWSRSQPPARVEMYYPELSALRGLSPDLRPDVRQETQRELTR